VRRPGEFRASSRAVLAWKHNDLPQPKQDAVADAGLPVRSELLKRSVLGRPRALSDAHVAYVLAWHDSRMTLKEVAASLGVSTTTVVHVIKSRGAHYKQAPPEERAATLNAHRAHRRALRAKNWL
jgi:hypothetical protein